VVRRGAVVVHPRVVPLGMVAFVVAFGVLRLVMVPFGDRSSGLRRGRSLRSFSGVRGGALRARAAAGSEKNGGEDEVFHGELFGIG